MRKLFLSFIALFSLSVAHAADFPVPTGYVTDTINLLTTEQNQALSTKLEAYEKETTHEIAILIINTTGNFEISEYATKVGNEWGVGKENVNNGILMVAAIEDRDFFMAIGSQMESAVTDGEAGDIWRDIMKPYFKDGDYYSGFDKGIDATIAAIAGETFTASEDTSTGGDALAMLFLLFGGLFLFIWLSAILGRSKAIWPGAVIGGTFGFGIMNALGSDFTTSLIGAAFFTLLGLAFDYIVSNATTTSKKSGKTPPWWAGGSGFGGGSSSGGSSGGFGGFGGGGFSGGGGGGSW